MSDKIPVDQFVGRKVRYLRQAMSMTPARFAERIGVSELDVTAFETGQRRISASKLWEVSKALEAPVAYFFDGL